MGQTETEPNRIHLLGHAGPIGKDIGRFGFTSVSEYLDFIRAHLPSALELTCTPALFDVVEDEPRGGRHDDAERASDLQNALEDPRTKAIIAANGGAYFTRILPRLDFSVLARRRTPLWALGFSEMTSLVNLVGSYASGRGVYWLCPNYLAWKIRPAADAVAAFAEFWESLELFLADEAPAESEFIEFGGLHGTLVHGRLASGDGKIIGGCLSVLAALVGSPVFRQRVQPAGRWLLLEDINEAPYRIDRHLAALGLAGWFEKLDGVLVGDFHTGDDNQVESVIEILKLHLPAERELPVVALDSVGHVWPMAAVDLHQRMLLEVWDDRVAISLA